MSRETTTADLWGTLVRWIVALMAPVVPAVALSGHDGTRPIPAPRIGAAASRVVVPEVLPEVPGSSRAPRSVPAVSQRVGPGFSIRPWTLTGFGPLFSFPASAATP